MSIQDSLYVKVPVERPAFNTELVADRAAYGLRSGQLQFIGDVSRGLACDCVCAKCGKALIAKKGSVRRHHFAHLEITGCRGSQESVLHRLAKELLAELTYVM